MGGPISFLLGIGMLMAEGLQTNAKRAEMQKYNKAKRLDRSLPIITQQRLEMRINYGILRGRNVGGINVEKLVSDIMEMGFHNYIEAQNEATLLIAQYLTETMSEYEYNRNNTKYEYRQHIVYLDRNFNLHDYICDDWGKYAEFDGSIEWLNLVAVTGKLYMNLSLEPIETQINAQADYWRHKRADYMLGYEFFANGQWPDWYEFADDIANRWRKELGIK